jgi:hypothetical protein
VRCDAVDADTGPVPTAYTLMAPADTTAVVSPLTTLVQQTVASTGASTSEAAKSVQDATGLSASVFQDYTKVAAPTDGTLGAATLARLLVITTQQQTSALASAVGTTAIDGATITQADIDKAIQKKLLELLPDVVTALNTPDVQAATTPAAKEAARHQLLLPRLHRLGSAEHTRREQQGQVRRPPRSQCRRRHRQVEQRQRPEPAGRPALERQRMGQLPAELREHEQRA